MAMFDREQIYGTNGIPRTKSLFAEYGVTSETILTFNDTGKPYPALKPLYIKFCVDDPSEAEFALAVFGDITFWEKLKNSPIMEKHLDEWRHETDVMRKSKAFKHIMHEIENDGRNSYSAAKFLIDEPWKPKTKESKQAKAQTTAEAVSASAHTDVVDFIKARKVR